MQVAAALFVFASLGLISVARTAKQALAEENAAFPLVPLPIATQGQGCACLGIGDDGLNFYGAQKKDGSYKLKR